MSLAKNLVELLELRCSQTPNRKAFDFVNDELNVEQSTTYRELASRAKTIAVELQRQSAAGERVLLLYPFGLDFVEAFFGCLYAGSIAVPVCMPRRRRPSRHLSGIITNAAPALVLSTHEYRKNRINWFSQIPALAALSWTATDRLDSSAVGCWESPRIEHADLAFLQYTSGSTGDPKGVMVSHGNLLHNAEMIHAAFDTDEQRSAAFWLPMYHDMGLIGGMLQTVYDGVFSAWMSPASFLQRPLRWLELISRTGATGSGAPDFAYDLCVRRSTHESRAGLDLSKWSVAFTGAEKVRPATMDLFCQAFEPYGFRREAFLPCYGLAEATLMVSAERKNRRPTVVHIQAANLLQNRFLPSDAADDDARALASSGWIGQDQRVEIVDPETLQLCRSGQIGEVWVHGPNVAKGYFHAPHATTETFQALILGGDNTQFLRTGDLGYVLDGELFITGRIKERIIIRGRNLHPPDLEWAVQQSHEAFQNGGGAAFSVDVEGQERLILVQECDHRRDDADFNQLLQLARVAVSMEFEIEVYDLLLVKRGAIPRTTSGKIRRLACGEAYLADQIDILARWQERYLNPLPIEDLGDIGEAGAEKSVAEIQQWLLERLATRFGVEPGDLDINQPFLEMGLSSLDAVTVSAEFEKWLGRNLPPTMLYNRPNVASLARYLGGEAEPTSAAMTDSNATAELENELLREVQLLSDEELQAFIANEMATANDLDAA